MANVSQLLKVYKTEHHALGELIELYSPKGEKGAAYFIDEDEDNKDVGVGLRLTKKTALKLAAALTKLAKEIK